MSKARNGPFIALIFGTVIVLVFSMMPTMCTEAKNGSFGGGDGTPANPYVIEDVWDLQNMSGDLSAHYALGTDINASATAYWNLGAGFSPVGKRLSVFNGSLDGRNHTITGLFINRSSTYYIGLFGSCGPGSVLKDLGLIDVSIIGEQYVGGLAGFTRGKVLGSFSTGTVTATSYDVGGLVGLNSRGLVVLSHSSAIVTQKMQMDLGGFAGGLLGGVYEGTVSDSYATGKVTGRSDYVGGLIGRTDQNSTVSNCYATGDVIGQRFDVGGLIGLHYRSKLTDCHATGSVTGGSDVGGLVGSNVMSNVSDAYANGNVSGGTNVGGLVGDLGLGVLSDTFSTGNVTGRFSVGGLVGWAHNGSVVSNSHYDVDHVSINGGHHITIGGLFDAQYQDWTSNGRSLDISHNSTTLVPSGNAFGIGDIQGLRDLLGFADVEGYKFLLTSDLNLSSAPGLYVPYLAADIDGERHTVSGLSVDLPFSSCLGLVGYATGEVRNVTVIEGEVTGYYYIGGLVGCGDGMMVSNSSADVDVEGVLYVGGLIGQGWASRSFAMGSVNGLAFVGGLMGASYGGEVSDSYASGRVNGTGYIGGLVGRNVGTISTSYSSAMVTGEEHSGGLLGLNEGTVSDSFWDTETSSQGSSEGGTGKDTTEMMARATFAGAGWDFTGTWCMIEGVTYPFLRWQDRQPPRADAGVDQVADEGALVALDGSGSFDDTGIANFTWTFVDGEPVILHGVGPEHRFDHPGIFVVTLNVTDPIGNWDTDGMTVRVSDITAPEADAGPDQVVDEGTSVTFHGDGSTDNVGVADWCWTFADGAPIILHGVQPTYTFDNPGVILIILNVTDAAGNWATDNFTVTVNDITPPLANAGTELSVDAGAQALFDGNGCSDSVGVVKYTWTCEDGVPVTLNGPTPSYRFDRPGTFVVTLNITDAAGNWAIDTMTVIVKDVTAPVADAGPDLTVDEGILMTFDGGASKDNVGILNYSWTFDNGGLVTLFSAGPSYQFANPGLFIVTLNVTDAAGNWGMDTMTVTVNDATPPVAEAGPDQTVNEADEMALDAGSSTDNVGIVAYRWTFREPVGIILEGISPKVILNDPGVYHVTLNVTDAAGLSSEDSMTLTVNDITPPMADAGPDLTVPVGSTIALNGSLSTDNVGLANHTWALTYDGEARALTGLVVPFTFDAAGVYEVVLTVADEASNLDNDTVVITVVDTGRVTGTVLDGDGKPVKDATVVVTASNGKLYTAMTVANGSFALDVFHGDFTWRISKEGYKSISGSSSVAPMEGTWLDLSDHPLVKEENKNPFSVIFLGLAVLLILIVVWALSRRGSRG